MPGLTPDGERTHNHQRLTPAPDAADVYPWQRADTFAQCSLYWAPVSSFPVPEHERVWFLEFLDLLVPKLKEDHGLRTEVFLQYRAVPAVKDKFLKLAKEFSPVLGLSRRPGFTLPRQPSVQDVKLIVSGQKKFEADEFTPDYCYWFLEKLDKQQREQFWGYGGLTLLFLKPDINTKPPLLPISASMRDRFEVLKTFDLDRMLAKAFSLKDEFLIKSKELMGTGWEQEPFFPGIPFVLPLLSSADFFNHPELVPKWFEIFEMCVIESPVDQGILIASKGKIHETLASILQHIRAENPPS